MLEGICRTETPLGLVCEELLDEIEGVLALSSHLDRWKIRKKPSQVHWRGFDECHLLSVRELFERLNQGI